MTRIKTQAKTCGALVAALLVLPAISPAQSQRPYFAMSIDPNATRIEQYAGSGTVIWSWPPGQGTFPGGSCAHLELPTPSSESDRSRLLALFLTAKVAHKAVVIHYFPDDCTLMSFAADVW